MLKLTEPAIESSTLNSELYQYRKRVIWLRYIRASDDISTLQFLVVLRITKFVLYTYNIARASEAP